MEMHRAPASLVSTALYAEMVRFFLENGYIPSRYGRDILASKDPELYWSLLAIFGFAVAFGLAMDLKALFRELRGKKLDQSQVALGAARFLEGKHRIGYSVLWSAAVSMTVLAIWILYVAVSGEVEAQQWGWGHWPSLIFLSCLAYFFDARSYAVTDSGQTLLLRRFGSITGNLAIPGISASRVGSSLQLENLGARYRIALSKLSELDRRVFLHAFLPGEDEKR